MRLWYQDQLCGVCTHVHTNTHTYKGTCACSSTPIFMHTHTHTHIHALPGLGSAVEGKTKGEYDTEETLDRRNMLWFLSASWTEPESQRRHVGNDGVEARRAAADWCEGGACKSDKSPLKRVQKFTNTDKHNTNTAQIISVYVCPHSTTEGQGHSEEKDNRGGRGVSCFKIKM